MSTTLTTLLTTTTKKATTTTTIAYTSTPARWKEGIVIAYIIIMLIMLVREVAPPDMLLLSAVALFLAFRCISYTDAAAGFANTSLLTILILYVVAAGLYYSGTLDYARKFVNKFAFRKKGKKTASLSHILFLCLFPFTFISFFINNTPMVAMLIPFVREVSYSLRLPASKLMIPLSYAIMLGGTCTLIGTSTNLTVQALAVKAGVPTISLFTITPYAVVVMFAGWLYLVLFVDRLPDRQTANDVLANPKRYMSTFVVKEGGPMVGKTIFKAGLRALPGVFLTEIERVGAQNRIVAPGPDTVLIAGDRLFFAGDVQSTANVLKLQGLQSDHKESALDMNRLGEHESLVEAVISPASPLLQQNIRDSHFRSKYGAVIIAVHRQGIQLTQKIGTIRLRAGDALLLLANKNFLKAYSNSAEFTLVSPVSGFVPRRNYRSLLCLVLFVLMIVLPAQKVVPFDQLFVSSFLTAAVMIVTRCVSSIQARESLNIQVYLVIAAALAISTAMVNSGASDLLAHGLQKISNGTKFGLYTITYIIVSILTEVIANTPAVSLMFPVAIAAAKLIKADLLEVSLLIMLAGSSSAAIPTGYQTNLMVYGPGGYRASDYLRFGLPYKLWIAFVGIGVMLSASYYYVWLIFMIVCLIIALIWRRKTRTLPDDELALSSSNDDVALNIDNDERFIQHVDEQDKTTVYNFFPDLGLVRAYPQEDDDGEHSNPLIATPPSVPPLPWANVSNV